MADDSFGNRTAQSVARQYVAVYGKKGRMISTAAGARAVRAAMSNCTYSDRELAQIIAEAAVRNGCNVHFDGHARTRKPLPSAQDYLAPDDPGSPTRP